MPDATLKVRIVSLGPRLDRAESRRRWRPVLTRWGSGLMRSHQLKALVAPHLPPHIEIGVSTLPRMAFRWLTPWIMAQPKAVFSLLKTVAHAVSAKRLGLLRIRARRRPAPIMLTATCAGSISRATICTSPRRLRGSRRWNGPARARTRPLLHHADPRLDGLHFPPLPGLSTAYPGNPANLHRPPGLPGAVQTLPVITPDDMAIALRRLPLFKLYHAVRPPEHVVADRPANRPFTKGMTVAACASDIVVNRDLDDAVALLGDDYPDLVDVLAPDTIATTLDKARTQFGTRRWSEALDRLTRIRSLVSGPDLARHFMDLLAAIR